MKKRMFLTLLALAGLLAAIGALKYQQIQAAAARAAAFQPPPIAVTTVVAAREEWEESLSAIGTLVAVQGVTVSADLPGVVERITFDSGRAVKRGEILVQLDTSQERAQQAAAEAEREWAQLNLDRIGSLRKKGVTSQAEYDQVAAQFKQAEARVGEIKATIERKTIRAPFAGFLGIRQVNLGQYLTGGDPVVALQALDPIYVDFTVPQQELARLKLGVEVRLTLEGTPREFTGKITATDSIVDAATRNVRVQATLENHDGTLRPGMFAQARVMLPGRTSVVALPASAVNYAPYGASVFLVEELLGPNGTRYRGVRQQFVKLGEGRGDQIAVLSGVEPGAEVVSSGTFKLRTGAAGLVNNEVRPANDPKARPEES